MNADAVVALVGVTKQYGAGAQAVAALSDVSLTIPGGQFVSIMGPSGSGKSTLLNIIAGLDPPTSGRVFVTGYDLGALSDDLRSDLRLQQLGFVFQAFNLFPTFTAEENVVWPLELLGIRWPIARQKAAAALQRVGLAPSVGSRLPAELSGGEQQRVAIARALVTEPSLLVADEPTGNLDSQTGTVILDLLRALNTESRLTVVMVTHSTYAATYGHRTVELRDGRIVRDVMARQEPTGARVVPLREA